MKEIWKDIKNYEGLYQVSNLGRIKSLPRNGTILSEKIIKTKPNKCGYLRICLHKNNTKSFWSVHRLVAQAFISNPNNYLQVNHKNRNKNG